MCQSGRNNSIPFIAHSSLLRKKIRVKKCLCEKYEYDNCTMPKVIIESFERKEVH